MTLLFHSKTLELLYKYKKYGEKETLIKVLSLILDNSTFIDISFLHDILFSFTNYNLDESLSEIIKKNFYKVKADRSKSINNNQNEVFSMSLNIKEHEDASGSIIEKSKRFVNGVSINKKKLETSIDQCTNSQKQSGDRENVINSLNVSEKLINQDTINSRELISENNLELSNVNNHNFRSIDTDNSSRSFSNNNQIDNKENSCHANSSSTNSLNDGHTYICFYKFTYRSRLKSLLLENRNNNPSVIGDLSNPNFICSLELCDNMHETSSVLFKNTSFFSSISCTQNLLISENYETTDKDKTISNNIIKENSLVTGIDESNLYLNPSSCQLDSVLSSLCTEADTQDNSNRVQLNESSKKRKKSLLSQSNILNFNRIQHIPNTDVKRFEPLELKNATFLYNRNNIILDTLRKRDDLVNPVQLQFIKHFDQIRPPIYQVRGILKKKVFSFEKIPGILSYDEDSSEEWEDVDENLSEDSIEESEDSGSTTEDNDWIEADSEEEVVESTRFNKKPVLFFDVINVQKCIEPRFFKNCSLVTTSVISDGLIKDIKEYLVCNKIDIKEKELQICELFNLKKEAFSTLSTILTDDKGN